MSVSLLFHSIAIPMHAVKPSDYECHLVTNASVVPTHYTALTRNEVNQSKTHINMKLYNTRTINKSLQQKVTWL